MRKFIPRWSRLKLLLALGALVLFAGALFFGVRTFLAPKDPLTTFVLPYVQNFDEVDLKRWFVAEGIWTLRDQHLAQTTTGDKAAQIHIPAKLPTDLPYHLSTYLTLGKSTRQAGLTFNAQYPQLTAKQQRAYVERRLDDSMELVAGYMDDTGSFVPQIQVPLSTDTQEYRLDVFVYADTYLVQLNGQQMMQERPLFYHNGLVGFHALGPAAFDNLTLTAADNVNPNDQVYTSDFDKENGGAGWVPIRGEWGVGDGVLKQSDVKTQDAAIAYESGTFTKYVLRTTFKPLQGVGAGVLFNMLSPYDLVNSHMVRFSNEADALVWGYFDSQGALVRQGSLNIEPLGQQQHTLQIYSGDASYDILLDDKLVARDIPLEQARGSIGLVTSHSSAEFSLVEVFPLFGAGANVVRQPTLSIGSTPTALATPATPIAVNTLAVPTAVPVSQANVQTAKTVVVPTHTAATNRATTAPSLLPASGPTPLPRTSGIVVSGAAKPYNAVFEGTLSGTGWRVISGDWQYADGALVQSNPNGFDQSASYVRNAFRDYSLTVTLRHQKGNGAGVLFNMPFNSRLNGAHMVRYSERRPGAIIYGYFDASGKFIGQGYADVPAPADDPHTFRIVITDSTYSITLDDTPIVQNLPLQQNFGYVGLITSQSAASFDEFTVAAPDAAMGNSSSSPDGFSNFNSISGKWTTEGNLIRQDVSAPADYLMNTGIFGSEYTLEATITLPDTKDAGGGIIFHMPERANKNGAYIARLVNGGTGVFWGAIQEDGSFVGKGSADLTGQSGTFLLKINVTGNRMSLAINGTTVAENVPLPRQEGWIGLLAYGGPVTFDQVRIQVGKPKPD